MRIIIDGVIFGLQKAGGISRLWCDLIQGYDNSGHEVIVLVPTNRNEEWKTIEKTLKNVRVLKRKRFRWGRRGWLDTLYLTWIAMKWRPNVWHQSYYASFPVWYHGVRITTLHDMIPEIVGPLVPYDSKRKYNALKKSDKIIAISHHSQNDLQKVWGFGGKSVVIHNGCSFREGGTKGHEEPYLLYVGKRGGYKNFLPAVLEILKEKRLKIKAVGGEKPREDELQISEVEYLGLCESQRLGQLYASASLLLFPSLYEGFGLPILEAFSWEVPVLAIDSPCIREVVGPDYPLATPGKLVETMEHLLSQKERWVTYGKERQKLFTVEKMVENVVRFYECAFRFSQSPSMPKNI